MKKTTRKTAPKPARKPTKTSVTTKAKHHDPHVLEKQANGPRTSGSVLASLYVKKPRPAPPAPVVAKRPPPPPPKPAVAAPPKFHLPVKPQPLEATHVEYSRDPIYKNGVMVDPGLTVVSPAHHASDFSSAKVGRIRWGRLVGNDDFRPDPSEEDQAPASAPQMAPLTKPVPPPPPGKRQPPPPPGARPAAPSAPRKRDGVCGFIDEIIMQGGRTKEQILELVLAQFPGRDPKATLTTIGIRPSHIRAKGGNPPPFVK